MQTLSNYALPAIPGPISTLAYDRTKLTEGIVHFGVGGFRRAHQAMYLDRLMNAGNIRYADGHIEKAKIDAKSPDSRIVWLLTYAGDGRKMYGDWEGVRLTPSAQDHGHE